MKIKLISLVIWITILTTSLYVVTNLLPPLIGSFRYFWAPLCVILILFKHPNIIQKKTFIIVLIYGIIFLGLLQFTLWKYMLNWDKNSLLEEYYALTVFTTILYFYLIRSDRKGLAVLSRLCIIFIMITVCMTHIALTLDPYVIRQSASPINFTSHQAQVYKLTGAAGYGYMQGLVCVIPILIYHIKYNKKMIFSRNILIVFLCLIILLHLRAQVFANIIITTLITIFSFVSSKKIKKSILPVFIIIFILSFIPVSFYVSKINLLASKFNSNSEIYYKLKDFNQFIQTPELDASTGTGSRASRYLTLIQAFTVNPVFGNASYNSLINTEGGGHLHWMNRISIWGIFGFSFYLFLLYSIYKLVRSIFDESFGFYYFLSVLAFISLGFIKTIAGREPFFILIIVIPSIYFLPYLKTK
jgi:hypothetical protein